MVVACGYSGQKRVVAVKNVASCVMVACGYSGQERVLGDCPEVGKLQGSDK